MKISITTEGEAQQETAKRKIEIEPKEEIEVVVIVVAVRFSLENIRDLVIEVEVIRRSVNKLKKGG